jgi:hypothetical protein
VNADAIPEIITAEARATYPNESSVIGTIEEYPTKADAQKASEHLTTSERPSSATSPRMREHSPYRMRYADVN